MGTPRQRGDCATVSGLSFTGPTPKPKPPPAGAPETGEGTSADGADIDSTEESADPGLLRLEFTSPAKAALITWAQGRESGRAGASGVPQFRYLVVPLRAAVRT